MSETSKYFRRIIDSSDTGLDTNIRVEQLYPQTDGQSSIVEGEKARDLLKDPGRVALLKVEYDPSVTESTNGSQKIEFRHTDQTATIDGWEHLDDGESLVDIAEGLFGKPGLSLVLESGITLRHYIDHP